MGLEFPGGRGDQVEKSWKFQGVGGNNVKPSGTENPGGWGLKLEKTLSGGGYGYFLEPHIVECVDIIASELDASTKWKFWCYLHQKSFVNHHNTFKRTEKNRGAVHIFEKK